MAGTPLRLSHSRTAILVTAFLIAAPLMGKPCLGQEQPTALEENCVTIKALLSKASSVHSEPLLASPVISDEKVSIAVDLADQGLLMRMLDLLPGYEWVEGISDDGSRFHVLGPDWGERALWEHIEFAHRMKRGKARIMASRLRLEEYMRALAFSEEELQALEYEDPWLVWALSNDSTRAIIGYLAQLPGEKVERIFKGGLAIPFAELPFEVQVEMVAWTHYQASFGYWTPPCEPEEVESTLLSAGEISLGYTPEGIEFGLSFPGLPQNREGVGGVGETLVRPRGLYVVDGRRYLRMQRGMPREQADKLMDKENSEFWDELARARRERLSALPPRFGGRDIPSVSLGRDLEGERTYSTLHDLCESANLPRICHYFDKRDHSLYGKLRFEKGTPLASAIDRIADEMQSVWAFADGAVILTSRELAKDLEQEIPEPVLVKWRERIELREGKLTLDDLAEMANELSRSHLAGISRALRSGGAGLVIVYRLHLLFYGSLDEEQRAQALKGLKISFESLTSLQRRLFERAANMGRGQTRLRGTSAAYFQISPHDPWIDFVYGFQNAPPRTFTLPVRAAHLAESQNTRIISDGSPADQSEVEAEKSKSPEQIAAVALAGWSFVGCATHDKEQLAILETRSGGAVRSRILQEGESLERASLDSISPDHLVFRVGQARLTLSISRAVSLPPWQGDLKTSSAP
ncbi:MAG: hypothetical protein GTO55_09540 [Armatimonadetes bacterium]|nr:hypothetical protein [Armatimonadota bacterium]NIM24490.1 hypothetical protein [Armatimonadota bacterium]NIM68361.1 hypothetical protein [Armatimonadota bacterium]NIM76761.1 hypothetical protein [Armatimonadota bacterium]NIN06563.1 hypothetical protein [Armatimonadota bacterium]